MENIINRAHKIRLEPNNKQITFFKKSCGCARFVYNWALTEWQDWYKQGRNPSAYELMRYFNSIKSTKFSWIKEAIAHSVRYSIFNLETAFKRFFNKQSKYPQFHKKGKRESFYIPGQSIKVSGNKVYLPKIGWIKMSEHLRFKGKINNVVVSEQAGLWFAAFNVEIEVFTTDENQVGTVGIDLGIENMATLSDGAVYENPRIAKHFEQKLRTLNKSLSRKELGSKNWQKAKRKLQRLHYRVGNIRRDYIHKFTSEVSRKYAVVCLEDLNVSGMVKNHRLAKALQDVSFFEIRRQFQYKANEVRLVNRFAPSSKSCSSCGHIQDMPLSNRVYSCDICGLEINRDYNAALNILWWGTPSKPVDMGALAQEALEKSRVLCETTVSEAGIKLRETV